MMAWGTPQGNPSGISQGAPMGITQEDPRVIPLGDSQVEFPYGDPPGEPLMGIADPTRLEKQYQ